MNLSNRSQGRKCSIDLYNCNLKLFNYSDHCLSLESWTTASCSADCSLSPQRQMLSPQQLSLKVSNRWTEVFCIQRSPSTHSRPIDRQIRIRHAVLRLRFITFCKSELFRNARCHWSAPLC